MASESDTVAQLQQKLAGVQNEVGKLQHEKRQMEEDFQQKRSKFKEMYYAKENSLQEQGTQLLQAKSKINEFESLIKSLRSDMEDIKVVASVSENTKQEAVENLRTHHQQEIESLQRVLEDSMEEQRNEMLQQFEMERKQWENERSELKQTIIRLEECLEEQDEDDYKDNSSGGKAKQEQMPYGGEGSETSFDAHQALIGDYSRHVSVLEKENDTLKRKMHEVCRMLEREQCEHDNLKQTWVAANSSSTADTASNSLLIQHLASLKEMLTDEQWSLLKEKRGVSSSENAAVTPSNDKMLNQEHNKEVGLSSDVENAKEADGHNAVFSREEVFDAETKQETVIGGNAALSSAKRISTPMLRDDQTRKESGDEGGTETTEVEVIQKEIALWKDRFENERKLRSEAEVSSMKAGQAAKQQIDNLTKKLIEFEEVLENIKNNRVTKETNDDKKLDQLLKSCDQMKENLIIVSRERDSLRRMYDKNRQQVDQEAPATTMEGIRASLRKYKDALVTAKMEKTEIENKLQSENSFLKSELSASQHSKDQIENALSSEIELLQAKNSSLQNLKNQFEMAISEKNDLKMKVEQQQLANDSIRTKSKEVIQTLREKLANEVSIKEHIEANLAASKNQLRSLQDSLETSEQVQRDFVKLSQSLQVELENIRVKEEKKMKEKQENSAAQQQLPSTSAEPATESPKNSKSFP